MAKKIEKKEKYIKFCPKCNSTNLSLDKSSILYAINYVCDDCSYANNIFPEIEISMLEKLKKKKSKTEVVNPKLIDTSYEKFIYYPFPFLMNWWGMSLKKQLIFWGLVCIILSVVLFVFYLEYFHLLSILAVLIGGCILTYFGYKK